MKYRKKPVVIDAVQWSGSNLREMEQFTGSKLECDLYSDTAWEVGKSAPLFSFKIATLEGVMKAMPGDYIIKGVSGEFYPCKPDIFEKTYEQAEDALQGEKGGAE